jgi:hypothetical protein
LIQLTSREFFSPGLSLQRLTFPDCGIDPKVRIKNTLVITARQIQLTEENALPAIEERLERIIPEILP